MTKEQNTEAILSIKHAPQDRASQLAHGCRSTAPTLRGHLRGSEWPQGSTPRAASPPTLVCPAPDVERLRNPAWREHEQLGDVTVRPGSCSLFPDASQQVWGGGDRGTWPLSGWF